MGSTGWRMWGGGEDSSDREQEKHLELAVAVRVGRTLDFTLWAR